ncbi:GNAT family N-acetyltransferase [Paraflavitalea pollutisoli]|uniref:GNAT family N-acetyltransferase n=1 Tax=Paraflavitalea pollutisoli TaxID=3034143 RepID=UPI0023EC65D6|nr:GNAT family N-acetyltransferase [Paraflavitalea sp. H1-2-19X]
MIPDITYRIASTASEFEDGKLLFREYVDSLDFELSFQDFAGELAIIDQQFNRPTGALLLAYHEGTPIGCSGVRRIDSPTAELKRMYVRDAYKGQRVGVQLLERSIQAARDLGYQKIRLDTIDTMTRALALYRSFGFYEIPAYRFNPLEGAVYMEKDLTHPA